MLIVDQSDDDRSQKVVEVFEDSLPLRYRRLNVQGTARARNVGIRETGGDIVVFLDHDCHPRPDWLTEAAAVFERHPNAGNVYGSVVPPKGMVEWDLHGWTPSRSRPVETEARIVGNLRHTWRDRLRLPRLIGMGACFFIRRDVVERVGYFDVHFGPGTRFESSEDGDYGYRTLAAGYSVVEAPSVVVEHFGFRDYASGAASRHIRAYQYSTGTWLMKILRMGDLFALAWIAMETWRYLSYFRPLALLSRRGPSGASHIVMFVRGLLDSFRLRIDRETGLYVDRQRHT